MLPIFSLQQTGDKAQLAISGALRGLSDTSGAETRVTISEEIDGILKEVIDIANTKHLGRYIFSGFTTDTQPFNPTLTDPADPNSRIASVQLQRWNTGDAGFSGNPQGYRAR